MFEIVTDTSANLDCKLLDQLHIRVVPFSFFVNDKEYIYTDTKGFDGPAYYNAIRKGIQVRTSQVPPQRYLEFFTPLCEAGREILFVGMSSGISGSFSSAENAAKQLRSKYPECKIRLVDTLGASLGEGLLVLKAAQCQKQGMTLDDTADYLLKARYEMCQVFTVEDLKYLRRSGRLSNIQTIVGTMLQIKPILQGSRSGQIICTARVRGRKQSIQAMADQYEAFVTGSEEQQIGIAHADCPEDAKQLIHLLNSTKCPPKDIMTVCYEPVTGSHVGPGALALFFWGNPEFRKP